MKQGYRCGLLPHPIAGQPGIFRLIPSLARKTHHSTVSCGLVGWHPAMDTRACFCSNIEKSRHILDWTRTSISESSVRHSAIELHAQGGHNLDCSQCLFMERDTGVAPVTSPWQGDELLLHQTRNKQHSALTVENICCCYNKEYSIIVV